MSTFAIRPYRLEDIDEVYAASVESRAEIAPWMGWMTPEYSREDTAKWVAQAIATRENGEAYEYLIVDSADGAMVGSCGLNHLNLVNGTCNLGYWVRTSRHGEGAACQAALLLRDFGFGTLGLNRLEIVAAVGNEFSRKVAENTGAVYEGVNRLRLKVGEISHDAHMFALLNPTARRPESAADAATTATVNWLDMIVGNPDRVSRFYTEVAGLSRVAVPEDESHTSYSLKNANGREVLGICDEAMFPDWPHGWLPYIDIPDFEARVAKVEETGGEILRQMKMDYHWKGQRFCLVRDPSGAPFMLCEEKGE
ncbi:GNAT family N-acetyltransferase [Luteolibacter yonseiensis]|uniref:GNAT family N-acetyltransferase n=1 Tax=Luteolibacter yonseiensis TaxID=1144680 RepID=A0A934R2C0_9BACT|nr:GNAT family N-acetyltransferase [Luteolibacter yonseiensis]MBK1815549.1 GNAT family N-acetyltransferase [Luteolibacter yonseiensis]